MSQSTNDDAIATTTPNRRPKFMSHSDDDPQDTPSYSEAIDELEEILESIESDEVDVDELAAQVERASELVQFCRETIDETEMQIESIIEDLRGDDEETGGRE